MCRKRYASSPVNWRVSGRTSSLRTSAVSRRPSARPAERLRRAPRWNTWPSTAPRSSTLALLAVELVEPGGEQRLDRRRHDDVAARRLRATSASISSTKSGLPSAASRIRVARASSSCAAEQARDQLLGLRARRAARAGPSSRSACRRPSRPAVEQLGPREAEEQDRRVRGSVGDVLDQVEEASARPSGCRRRRRRAAARRRAPRAAAGPPRAISSERGRRPVAERAPRAAPPSSRSAPGLPSWRTISTTGQYVIPSP